MAQKRKRHLRYQQKKGNVVATGSRAGSTEPKDKPVSGPEATTLNKRKVDTKDFTKLPEIETRFIRKELVFIALVALAVIIGYIGIFLVFRTTQLDEWLNSLIRLS